MVVLDADLRSGNRHKAADRELLTVWRRSGPTRVRVPLARYSGGELDVEVAFPKSLPTQVGWDAAAGELVLDLPDEPAARTLTLRGPGRPRR